MARGNELQEFDVCLSFAGEDRAYVARVARALQRLGVRVFYDEYEKAALWGKDLYEHLNWVYTKAARFCVLFASEHYAAKVWTNHERRRLKQEPLRRIGSTFFLYGSMIPKYRVSIRPSPTLICEMSVPQSCPS
jgi:hypothetical protein